MRYSPDQYERLIRKERKKEQRSEERKKVNKWEKWWKVRKVHCLVVGTIHQMDLNVSCWVSLHCRQVCIILDSHKNWYTSIERNVFIEKVHLDLTVIAAENKHTRSFVCFASSFGIYFTVFLFVAKNMEPKRTQKSEILHKKRLKD